MRHHLSWISWAAILAALLLLLAPRSAHGQPVILSVETHRGRDTLYVGERAFIAFDVDGRGGLQGLVYPLEFTFAPAPSSGPCRRRRDILCQDSMDLDHPTLGTAWRVQIPIRSSWDWCRLAVRGSRRDVNRPACVPSTEGGRSDSNRLDLPPPANHLAALDPLGQNLAVEWHSPVFTVLPCPTVLGDVNEDGKVTAADIILFARCIFMCSPGPGPYWILAT